MHRVLRVFLCFLFVAPFCLGTAADAQSSPSPAPPATSPEPTPIPLAKLPLEAESTMSALQEISASVSSNESAAAVVAGNLATLAAEIDARVVDDSRLRSSS